MTRWLIDSPADGPTNMARDEAILIRVGEGHAPPTLRFYRWSPATISLGYFQKHSEYLALPEPAGLLPVVRRQTGGGAILHDSELTYSLVLPLQHALIQQEGASHLYRHVHSALADLLRALGLPITFGPETAGACSHRGPFFCFERHCGFDLLAGDKKIVGSAQRRSRTAVLQHGSLILKRRYRQQECAAMADYGRSDIDAHLSQLACAILGEPTEAAGSLSPGECRLAKKLRAKYADSAWTKRR